MVDLAAISAGFGEALHAAGVPVTPERSARFAAAVSLVEPGTNEQLYWLGRITLLSRHEHVETFDRLFKQFFEGTFAFGELVDEPVAEAGPQDSPTSDADEQQADSAQVTQFQPQGTGATPSEPSDASDDNDQPMSLLAAMSDEERLNTRHFSELTDDELDLIAKLVDELQVAPPMRRGRRTKRHVRGRDLDIRSTLRRSHRTAGDPVRLVYRNRTPRPRKVVLIADVSGSMEPYARVYVHLLRGAVVATQAEAFVFATRLTRITRSLRLLEADAAYRQARDVAPDWSGGTRIGSALLDFVESFGRRGMARGSVVVIVSDGWETDDPERIDVAMGRLSRLAHHIIWVNPRKAATDYQPLVGGMAAALPYVDTFISGHSLTALEDVVKAIQNVGSPS